MLIPINKETVRIRLDDLLTSVQKLEKISKLSYEEFSAENSDHFALASYRLVHGYLHIAPDEIYNKIFQKHLTDLRQFGVIINELLKDPSKFNLTVE